jgi:hypothetical protein
MYREWKKTELPKDQGYSLEGLHVLLPYILKPNLHPNLIRTQWLLWDACIPQQSHATRIHPHNNIQTDCHKGFVTLKDLKTPWWWLRLRGRNMLEWWNNNKLIQEFICPFCWFYSLHYWVCTVQKTKQKNYITHVTTIIHYSLIYVYNLWQLFQHYYLTIFRNLTPKFV